MWALINMLVNWDQNIQMASNDDATYLSIQVKEDGEDAVDLFAVWPTQ